MAHSRFWRSELVKLCVLYIGQGLAALPAAVLFAVLRSRGVGERIAVLASLAVATAVGYPTWRAMRRRLDAGVHEVTRDAPLEPHATHLQIELADSLRLSDALRTWGSTEVVPNAEWNLRPLIPLTHQVELADSLRFSDEVQTSIGFRMAPKAEHKLLLVDVDMSAHVGTDVLRMMADLSALNVRVLYIGSHAEGLKSGLSAAKAGLHAMALETAVSQQKLVDLPALSESLLATWGSLPTQGTEVEVLREGNL